MGKKLQLNSDRENTATQSSGDESTSSTENREPENKPKPTHKTIVKMEKEIVMERYTDEDGFMVTKQVIVNKPKEVSVKINNQKTKPKVTKPSKPTASSKGKGGKGKNQSIASFFKPK